MKKHHKVHGQDTLYCRESAETAFASSQDHYKAQETGDVTNQLVNHWSPCHGEKEWSFEMSLIEILRSPLQPKSWIVNCFLHCDRPLLLKLSLKKTFNLSHVFKCIKNIDWPPLSLVTSTCYKMRHLNDPNQTFLCYLCAYHLLSHLNFYIFDRRQTFYRI